MINKIFTGVVYTIAFFLIIMALMQVLESFQKSPLGTDPVENKTLEETKKGLFLFSNLYSAIGYLDEAKLFIILLSSILLGGGTAWVYIKHRENS